VSAPGELASQRNGRKGVTGIAEGGQQDAPAPPAQSISASSRTVRLRSSDSGAITDAISVPTPASR
jgi:hypothetical protein